MTKKPNRRYRKNELTNGTWYEFVLGGHIDKIADLISEVSAQEIAREWDDTKSSKTFLLPWQKEGCFRV